MKFLPSVFFITVWCLSADGKSVSFIESRANEKLLYGVRAKGEGTRCLGACQCYDTEYTVDCSGKSYDVVPYGIPLQTKLLDLSGNDITEVASTDFQGLSNVDDLDLSHNSISSIADRAFHDMSALTILKLDNNENLELRKDVFIGLSNLEELNLQYGNVKDVPPGAFIHLANLKSLILDFNVIFVTSLTNESFSGLTELMSLSMASSYLYEIPMNSLQPMKNTLKSLTMSLGSRMTSIGGADSPKIDLPYLENLNLSSCRIQSILGDNFDGMPNLKNLDLTGNDLSTLFPRTFTGVQNLTFLRLGQNPLITFPYAALHPVSHSLSYLHMGYMSVTEIGNLPSVYNATFLSNLVTLIFEGGRIEIIRGDSFFKNLKSLEYLKIANTKLKTIPIAAMNHLTSLRTACLMYNPILKLEKIDVPQLKSLREFEVTGTDVLLLEEDIFAGLSLTVLKLNDNKITNISSRAFQSLSDLMVIDISSNLLEIPYDKWFEGKPLQEVFMRGNPWSCDCNAEKYRAWTETAEYKSIPKIDPVECDVPRSHRSSHLSSLKGDDLTCDFSECPSVCVCTESTRHEQNQFYSSKFDAVKTHTMQNGSSVRTNPTGKNMHNSILDLINFKDHENDKPQTVKSSITSTADCTGSKVTEIPRVPSTTEFLNVATNRITSLRKKDFSQLSNLRIFVGSENVIEGIENGTFSGSHNLEKIYLNRNKISGPVSPSWFNNLKELRELRLDDNHLEEISSQAFAALESLEILDLSDNYLRSLGNDTFRGLRKLEYLNLADNSISSVEEETFGDLPRLAYLYLNTNSLTKIPSRMVLGNKLLLYLDIGQNSFGVLHESFLRSESIEVLKLESGYNHKLENGSFRSLPNLKVLRLAGSGVNKIDDEAFLISPDDVHESGQSYNQSKILTLDLGFNQISDVPLKSFFALSSLESLSLNNNLLQQLPPWDDDKKKILTTLQTIYLAGNADITEVPSNSFISRLQNLLALVMNDCSLTRIPIGALKNLPKIRHLVLDQNPIAQIPDDLSELLALEQIQLSGTNTLNLISESAFQNLKNLTRLSLSRGRIHAIPPLAFKSLKNLEVLDLSRNELTHPHSNWFASLDPNKVKSISLHHNPWVCDCNSTEYKQWINNGANGLDEHFVSITCESPQEHKSLTISEVNAADLTCGSAPEKCHICTFDETAKLANCSMQKLSSIPKDCIPPNTVMLDVSNNAIEQLVNEDLRGLKDLQELDISRNRISDISMKAFDGLPSMRILDMSSNKLFKVPTEALSPLNTTLQELALDSQNISRLAEHAFLLPHLKVLSLTSLAGNRIKPLVVENFSFEKLTDLEKLDLANNALTSSLDLNTFTGLDKLTELNLVNTKLEEFPVVSMIGVPNLIQLNLNENSFSTLGPSDVPIITNLKKLFLRDCKVEVVTESSFLMNCTSLEELDLGRSLLQSVPTTALQNKPSLQFLRLDDSQITEISASDFPPGNLNDIDLTESRIHTIGALAFGSMNHLSKLDLKENRITEIADDAFRNTGLRYLDISYNQLTYVSCSWFDSMSDGQLQTLKLSGNNYHCSCEMVGYRDYMSTLNYDLIGKVEEPICESPAEFADQPLGEIELAELETYCASDTASTTPVYCSAKTTMPSAKTTMPSAKTTMPSASSKPTHPVTTTSHGTYFKFSLVSIAMPIITCYSSLYEF